jgi:hypothetical protein
VSAAAIAATDPEVAAAVLQEHMDALWASGRADLQGWWRSQLDPLRWVVLMPATTPDGDSTHFFVRLDGRCYDFCPPDVQFVDPDDWEPASGGRWWPVVDAQADASRSQWFGLHPAYAFPDGGSRPLVCFSHTLGYYESNHAPSAETRWRQGEHTVAATLSRVAEILSPAYFRGAAR